MVACSIRALCVLLAGLLASTWARPERRVRAAGRTEASSSERLRFGVLGAAKVSGGVLFGPLRNSLLRDVATVVAVGARDLARASEVVKKLKSSRARAYAGYAAVLADPAVDCVYIPLVNGLHYAWTIRALEAGKHVLVEKPLALNAEEARRMVDLAQRRNLVLMEGMHWYQHPFRKRMQEALASPDVGTVHSVNVTFEMQPTSFLAAVNPRSFNFTKGGGGAGLSIGGYVLSCLVALAGNGEPAKVEWARAERWSQDPTIDEGMHGAVRFGVGKTRAYFHWTFRGVRTGTSVVAMGSSGSTSANNFLIPHSSGRHGRNSITIRTLDGQLKSTEHVKEPRGLSTYQLQLLAFRDAVRAVRAGTNRSTSFANTGEPVVALAALLDDVYTQAGLRPRSGPARAVA
jgi:predicted dehydrogenase